MSEYKRLKRAIKSVVMLPFKDVYTRERYYEFSDAKLMIADLGLQIPPEILEYLTENQVVLDEFITAIYRLEDETDRDDIISEFTVIDTQYEPTVYIHDNNVLFTVTVDEEEILFIDYNLPNTSK